MSSKQQYTHRSYNWLSEHDEILIDYVRSHECLYNVRSKNYRKSQLKQKLWNEIGGILSKTGLDCSKRWAYVRDFYIRRRGRPPGTFSYGEAARKRAERLTFLDSVSSNKRSIITNTEETAENRTDLNWDNNSNGESSLDEVVVENISGIDSDTSDAVSVAKPSIKRKRLSFKIENSEESIQLLRQIAERQQLPMQEQDETSLFFASMAKIVKKLSERDQAILRLQIGTLVGNAELKSLSKEGADNQSIPTSSYTSKASLEECLSVSEAISSPLASSSKAVFPH